MKLQNWLIFFVPKAALFFASVLCWFIIPVEIICLITGSVPVPISGNGISFTNDGLGYYYDRIMLYIPAIILTASIAYACWQLGMMLDSIENNKEFMDRNYKRLFNAGVCVIISDLVLLLFDVLNKNIVRHLLHASAANNTSLRQDEYSFSFTWLLVGCILMILAKAFKRGTEIQEDNELIK
jgi:uncharacterized membrane protein